VRPDEHAIVRRQHRGGVDPITAIAFAVEGGAALLQVEHAGYDQPGSGEAALKTTRSDAIVGMSLILHLSVRTVHSIQTDRIHCPTVRLYISSRTLRLGVRRILTGHSRTLGHSDAIELGLSGSVLNAQAPDSRPVLRALSIVSREWSLSLSARRDRRRGRAGEVDTAC
jgi:hypothetical protein